MHDRNSNWKMTPRQREIFRWIAGAFLVLTGLLILSGAF